MPIQIFLLNKIIVYYFVAANVGIIYGQSCKPKYIAGYNISRLYKDGSLLENKTVHSLNRYCIERQYMSQAFLNKFKMVKNGHLTVYICGAKKKSLLHQFIILLISCIFLLLTLLVYLLVPDLRGNSHGQIVMCNVLSILLAFASLLPVKARSTTNFEFSTCAAMGKHFINIVLLSTMGKQIFLLKENIRLWT